MSKVKLTIDGIKIEAEEKTLLIEAAKAAGVNIPVLCYMKELKPFGVCKVCLCEVKDGENKKLITACNAAVKEGMEISTTSQAVYDGRKQAFEKLLAKAPNAETIINMAKEYGVDPSKITPDPDADNCILCGLCVRMCGDVVGAKVLSFQRIGNKRVVALPDNKEYPESCIKCGACAYVCPTGYIRVEDVDAHKISHSELQLGPTTAIYVPSMQATPNVPVIDTNSCIHFKTGGCGICQKACETNAIDFDMKEEIKEVEVGNVVITSGYEPFNPERAPQYGYGKLPNVVTSIEFEKMTNASGPTGGKILMANGEEPKSIAILHCIGSRDKNYNAHCSRVCCMYSLKFAHLVIEKTEADVYQLYIDMRAFGKGYEEFYERIQKEGSIIIRGKAAEVTDFAETPEEEGKLVVLCEDTLAGIQRRIPVDMVVLGVGLEARKSAGELARAFNISQGADGFFIEKHPKLDPVATTTDGIFIAGCCQGPKDIPDTVAQASAAAARVIATIDKGKVEIEGICAYVDDTQCSGCRICLDMCPYHAIEFIEDKKVCHVNEALCKGCGTCVAACPSGAMTGRHFTNKQIMAEIEGILHV